MKKKLFLALCVALSCVVSGCERDDEMPSPQSQNTNRQTSVGDGRISKISYQFGDMMDEMKFIYTNNLLTKIEGFTTYGDEFEEEHIYQMYYSDEGILSEVHAHDREISTGQLISANYRYLFEGDPVRTIFMQSDDSESQNHSFEYSDGKISKIIARSNGNESTISFVWEAGNVVKLTIEETVIHEDYRSVSKGSFTLSYDTQLKNPFKREDFFYSLGFVMDGIQAPLLSGEIAPHPPITPFLSENFMTAERYVCETEIIFTQEAGADVENEQVRIQYEETTRYKVLDSSNGLPLKYTHYSIIKVDESYGYETDSDLSIPGLVEQTTDVSRGISDAMMNRSEFITTIEYE